MNFEYKTIDQASKEAFEYINARKEGTIKSLKTGWKKLDVEILNGLEWHSILLVAGMSSSGKTLLMNQLDQALHDLNQDEDFISINMNYEMLARTIMIRKMSSRKEITMKQLLSAEDNFKLTDDDMVSIKKELKEMSKYNMFFIDTPQTTAQMEYIIGEFWKKYQKPMVISLDHTILIKRSSSDLNTTDMMYNFFESLTKMKKIYPVIFIIASQLNREIEDMERNKRPSVHMFPKKMDLAFSDSGFQHADIVLVNHRPAQLNITHYGPERWEVTENDLFWHILKNRQGSTPILKMIADFKHMRIVSDDFFETKLTN